MFKKSLHLSLLMLLFSIFSFQICFAQDDDELEYDAQQVELIKKGLKYWNAYLKAKPDAEIRLSGASLAGVDLSGMNLAGADLREADLRGVKCHKTNMEGADMSGADLGEFNKKVAFFTEANLNEVNLNGADMTGAKLIKVKMQKADLNSSSLVGVHFRKVDLRGADLSESDLENAIIIRTILIDANMEDIENIKAVEELKEVIYKEEEMHYFTLPDIDQYEKY